MKVYPADILLPDFSRIDGKRWATVACDQYTSEPEYWDRVAAFTSGCPTTLELMLPEVMLADAAQRTPIIHETMENYLRDGILAAHKGCGIYLERTQSDGRIRRGLIAAIDLEDYDYRPGAVSPIRATEKTVVERIPPRLAVRRGAPLEMPHVMLLADDRYGRLLSPFIGKPADAYDFDLMEGGGHVRGSFVSAAEVGAFSDRLNAICAARGVAHPMILAVGDGNHSLATAKAAWEEIKATLSPADAETHPARFALVEIVNLHDTALDFEPIYRVVTLSDAQELAEAFSEHAASLHGTQPEQEFTVIAEGWEKRVIVPHPELSLPVATLQDFLDRVLPRYADAMTDYIHGDDTLIRLAERPGNVGFLFEGMGKEALFSAVEADGALPRKTFSMGHAADKRFYVECRRIGEKA